MVVDAATIVQPEVKVHQVGLLLKPTGLPRQSIFRVSSFGVLQGRLRSTVAAARPDEDEEMLPQGYKDQVGPIASGALHYPGRDYTWNDRFLVSFLPAL